MGELRSPGACIRNRAEPPDRRQSPPKAYSTRPLDPKLTRPRELHRRARRRRSEEETPPDAAPVKDPRSELRLARRGAQCAQTCAVNGSSAPPPGGRIEKRFHSGTLLRRERTPSDACRSAVDLAGDAEAVVPMVPLGFPCARHLLFWPHRGRVSAEHTQRGPGDGDR
ncbi:unnamed protein product [Rangifer tarandus platyrhynchus]|uniref:Uncharacterized protein n=1 Tax=Rangifer tarandus platyrhynchus TaxID=3082113 RepID=A0AC59YB29_RANTA